MTYEFNRKQFARALKKAKKRGQNKMTTVVKDSLDLSKVGEPRDENIINSFPTTHHLNLQSLDQVPEDILFPEECNRYLRSQIQDLTAQNGRLLRDLEEKEADLRLCINQNEQLLSDTPSPLIGLGRASELAASKIVELSKRVRELTAEYEGAKTRWRTAEKKLKAYERGEDEPSPQHTDDGLEQEKLEPNENEMKSMTEKLNATMSKLCESRNQNQQLKQELKLANKALASEIGEAVSIHSITSNTSGWKGRAEQILSLQQKVAGLQEKLKEHNGEEKLSVKNSGVIAVRQMGKERQAAYEQMSRDLQERTQQLEEVKRKLEAMRARCRVWETEIERKKKTIDHYMQVDDHDKELIKTLTAELENVEKRQEEQAKKENRKAAEWEQKYRTANEVYIRERSKNEQLEKILRQKEEKIQQYQVAEEGRGDERGSAKHRYSGSRLNSRQSSISPDVVTEQGENQTLLLAAEAERIRLIELVALLNHRLEDQRSRAAETTDSLRRERAKSARLEARVGRLEMEKVGLTRGSSYAGSRSSLGTEPSPVKEGVRYKMELELLQEELLALKARLDCVQQEKDQDLKIYKNAFDEVQRVFLEGSKQGTSLHHGRSLFSSR